MKRIIVPGRAVALDMRVMIGIIIIVISVEANIKMSIGMRREGE